MPHGVKWENKPPICLLEILIKSLLQLILEYNWNLPSCSSILSHSSRIKCFVCFRLRDFSLVSANILPGVPTTMCGQLVFSTCWSFLMLIPPKKTAILILLMYLQNLSYSLWIWNANSRVWHMTNTLTWPSTGSSCWSVARTNTAVLPIPLFAWQMISIPRMACGMHSCWTVNDKTKNT